MFKRIISFLAKNMCYRVSVCLKCYLAEFRLNAHIFCWGLPLDQRAKSEIMRAYLKSGSDYCAVQCCVDYKVLSLICIITKNTKLNTAHSWGVASSGGWVGT